MQTVKGALKEHWPAFKAKIINVTEGGYLTHFLYAIEYDLDVNRFLAITERGADSESDENTALWEVLEKELKVVLHTAGINLPEDEGTELVVFLYNYAESLLLENPQQTIPQVVATTLDNTVRK